MLRQIEKVHSGLNKLIRSGGVSNKAGGKSSPDKQIYKSTQGSSKN